MVYHSFYYQKLCLLKKIARFDSYVREGAIAKGREVKDLENIIKEKGLGGGPVWLNIKRT